MNQFIIELFPFKKKIQKKPPKNLPWQCMKVAELQTTQGNHVILIFKWHDSLQSTDIWKILPLMELILFFFFFLHFLNSLVCWCHVASCHLVNTGSENGLVPSHYVKQCWLVNIVNTTTTINNINGLAQDRSNSIANALELLQSCDKPLVSTGINTNPFQWKYFL